MRRRETAELFPGPSAETTARPTLLDPRIGLLGLVGMMTILVLLSGARLVFAEPADSLDGAMPHEVAPPPAAVTFSADRADSGDNPADVLAAFEGEDAVVDIPPVASGPPRAALTELLLLRGSGTSSWKPQTTDEVLAAAVADGTNPDLEPRSAFRKRSRDLFRLERPVSIGDAEMLLRLRLRAKASEAMSVELRF